jgi:type 1 glutamine amidotransferase
MSVRLVASAVAVFVVVIATVAAGPRGVTPQQRGGPPTAQSAQGRADGPGGVVSAIFTLLDANTDAVLTRDEVKTGFDAWYTQWDASKSNALTLPQVFMGLNTAVPPAAAGEQQPQNRTPRPEDVTAMMAALPDRAQARPRQSRRVLVLARAAGFVHSSIPLAARTIEEMGKKTGGWSTTVTYDAADINDANLSQFDAIFLASTTGAFLDDANDAAATAARRKALLAFVRGGKGLAGIHAATDSYHRSSTETAGRGGTGGINWSLVSFVLQVMTGDANGDGRLTREEFAGFAGVWYDRLDPDKTGRIARAEFPRRYAALPPPPAPDAGRGNRQGPATDRSPDTQVGTWPEFNQLIGAFFKFHWDDGQTITVKIDEPAHPLNAAFKGHGYVIVDETYTFGRDTYSRQNLRVLTSVDYAKMSDEDKAKEQNPRTDGDYALSWIRREGKGRMFYEAHGHNEKVYANKALLEHVLAGMQYVLGDLAADDRPSASPAK